MSASPPERPRHRRRYSRRPRRPRGYRQAGFTLIELMVASAIFVIGMVGVFALGGQVAQQTAQANFTSIAANLASSGLEELRMNRYAQVVGDSDCSEPDPLLACHFDVDGQEVASPSFFLRTWSAQVDAVNEVTDVTVTVSWRDRQFQVGDPQRSVTMRGRVARR